MKEFHRHVDGFGLNYRLGILPGAPEDARARFLVDRADRLEAREEQEETGSEADQDDSDQSLLLLDDPNQEPYEDDPVRILD